jgi:hypothetical protein
MTWILEVANTAGRDRERKGDSTDSHDHPLRRRDLRRLVICAAGFSLTALALTTFVAPAAALGKSTTTTTLAVSSGSVSTGTPVTLTATVTNPSNVTQGLVRSGKVLRPVGCIL